MPNNTPSLLAIWEYLRDNKSLTSEMLCKYSKCPHCCSALKAEEVKPAEESDFSKGLSSLKKIAKSKISKIKK